MRLGTQTGSLVNHLQSRAVIGEPAPVVGMGATMLGWTDRNPGTIVQVERIGKKTVVLHVQADDYIRTDSNGMSEDQDYEFTPNPNGAIHKYTKDRDGIWRKVWKNPETGRYNYSGGSSLRIGERGKYHDFSF